MTIFWWHVLSMYSTMGLCLTMAPQLSSGNPCPFSLILIVSFSPECVGTMPSEKQTLNRDLLTVPLVSGRSDPKGKKWFQIMSRTSLWKRLFCLQDAWWKVLNRTSWTLVLTEWRFPRFWATCLLFLNSVAAEWEDGHISMGVCQGPEDLKLFTNANF